MASFSSSVRRTSTPSPPKKSSVLLPGLAFPDTPPSSPLLNVRQNAFAQWSPFSTPPSSPTLSQDQWSHPGTDTESEAGFHSDREELDGELPDGVRTPKGHPLGAWGARKSKGLGLGLGLGRFAFCNDSAGGHQEVLSVSEEMFEKRAERKRESIHDRSPFLISTQTSGWSFPKLRAPRKRGAIYGFAAILFFFVFLSTHSKSLGRTPESRPLSSLPHRRHQVHFADSGDALVGAGAPTKRGSVQTTAARKRGSVQHATTAPVVGEWSWAGKDMELASLLTFMVASEANTVPNVDPSAPLDPHLVLDFDPFSVRAKKDLREMRATLWRDHPVVFLSQTRNAHSRFIKSTLADLHIHPAPLIMDIDQRSDADTLLPLFQRLIGRSELPILLVGGELVGGWTEVDRLTSMNLLKPLISSHGGFFVPPKHKKKKRAGHGGKSEEELKKALDAEIKADEIKRRELAVEKEELRLRLIAEGMKEVIPVEDESDPEIF
ncbi:hypothetical protein BDY24DRAFT_8704 [Mrakia frigida]|uniref:uncharacterized protein n=1 Tax=Mrakia frigida TaxID=29902 RepID=UPI003FCC0798